MKLSDFFMKKSDRLSVKPYAYLTPSIGSVRKGILILLVPQIVMLLLTKSFVAVIVVLSAALGSVIAESVVSFAIRRKKFEILSPLIQGLLTGMLLPSTYSPVAALLITMLTMLFCKYVFGGFASSWINAPAVAVTMAYLMNMGAFNVMQLSPDDLGARNAAMALIQGTSFKIISIDSAITSFLNRTVFGFFNIVIPDGYISLLWDTGSLIPAFRFNLLTILSSLVLFSLNMQDFLIPFIFIAVYGVLVRFVGPLITGGPALQGDVILALLTSGLLFSTLYLLQWYGTVPITRWGKSLYGACAGIVAFLIVGMGDSPVGFVFMILCMNIISAVIQVFESHQVRIRLEKNLVPRMQAIKEAENA